MSRVFITLSILFQSIAVIAQQQGVGTNVKKNYEHVKERTISKTYSATGNTLQIENQFGSVTVTTWDRNEIKVDVHVKASASREDIAEKIFNGLEVEESKSGSTIQFKSKLNGNKSNNYNCNNCSSQMEMNYTIQLPASIPLSISNEFGSIKVPDYNGSIKLVSKFGSLTTGTLSNPEKIWIEFGKATIKSLSNATATFKFSSVTIENLNGNNTIEMEFCNSNRINMDNNLTGLNLNNSYSTVNLRPASGFSATYKIRTSFGSVKNRSNASIERTDKPDEYGPDSERTYEGKSGSGAAKIDIKSSFGTIIIGEATEEEMKEKKKNKKKAV